MIQRYLFCQALITIVLVCSFQSVAHSASRGITLKTTNASGSAIEEIELYQDSFALIIGVSDYTDGWPDLPGVDKDVHLVKTALEDNGFAVTLVLNPDKVEMDTAFEKFIAEYGGNANNRLLFYFAGHGHTIEPPYGGKPLGYIVPRDAPNPNRSTLAKSNFKRLAMSMNRIEEYALNIDAKHALFLFDSCFSGSIFSMVRAIPEYISYKTAEPVRQFITSGSANETVSDDSIFRHQFIEALEGEGDVNGDGYITGTELGEFLQNKVLNYSYGSQTPQYSKIRNPNLDKGDFVFVVSGDGPLRPNDQHPTQEKQKVTQPHQSFNAEEEMWKAIRDSNKIEDIQAYLTEYPSGRFTSVAKVIKKRLLRNKLTTLTADRQDKLPKIKSAIYVDVDRNSKYLEDSIKDILFKNNISISQTSSKFGSNIARLTVRSKISKKSIYNEKIVKVTTTIRMTNGTGETVYSERFKLVGKSFTSFALALDNTEKNILSKFEEKGGVEAINRL